MPSPDDLDTRARLLAAAIEVLESDGEVAVRVRAVSARAGVSYASLYHFFQDREGLIVAAQAERFRRSLMETLPPLRVAIEACTSRDELRAIIEAGLRGMWSAARADVRRARMESLAAAVSRPRLAALLRDVQHDYNEAVAAALVEPRRRGWVRDDIDLEMFAAWALGVTTGRVFVEMDEDRSDAEAWNRIAVEAIFGILQGD